MFKLFKITKFFAVTVNFEAVQIVDGRRGPWSQRMQENGLVKERLGKEKLRGNARDSNRRPTMLKETTLQPPLS